MKKLIKLSLLLLTIHLSLIVISAQTEQKAELVVQTGHNQGIASIAFSSDGKIFATGGYDNTIKIWDVNLNGEIRTLSGHSGIVWSVVFSPDGKTLATGSVDGIIKLWNVQSGKEIFTLKEHRSNVYSIVFSPDGNTLASASGDESIKLWDVFTGNELNTLKAQKDGINSVVFSLDGKILISGSSDNTIKFWDVATGKVLNTLLGHKYGINSVAISPNGRILASAGTYEATDWIEDKSTNSTTAIRKTKNNFIRLWDAVSGKELKTLSGQDFVSLVAFSPDGKILASGDEETIKLWNVETGKEMEEIDFPDESFSIYRFAFSPDSKTLVLGGFGELKLWDVKNHKVLKSSKGNASLITSTAFSPEGNILAVGTFENTIKLWDITSNKELRTFNSSEADNMGVISMKFSPNGKSLIGVYFGDIITLWGVSSGKEIKSFSIETHSPFPITFSPDGKSLALVDDDSIKIMDVDTGKFLTVIPVESEDYVASISFSPDGKFLVSGLRSGVINYADVASGKKIQTLTHHAPIKVFYTSNIFSSIEIGFSTDGKTLASGGEDQTVKLWNAEDGKLLETLDSNASTTKQKVSKQFPQLFEDYYGGAVSESYIAEIKDDGKIILFEKENHKELATLIALNENDWAVITPEGLFDASPNARKLMHYIIGFEPITLEQMKDLYYVPGILQKIFKGEPLPKVELFSKKDLFPDVEFSQPSAGQTDLKIKLVNRGGGIGQVQVLVNGKEFVNDARLKNFDVNAKETTLTVSLKDAPFIVGKENKIEVIAKNAAGSLTNRGTARGTAVFNLGGVETRETPNIYVIAGGISNYTGDNLKLNFAAKDAEDFAKAIELGAVKLLGDKSKVHIRLLTSNGDKSTAKFDVADAKISTATKKDFENAFADFKDATPNDVFIVYLSGHGVSLNLNQNPSQAGGDTYLYLTQEATTTDKSVLSIENSRKAMAISSEELKDLMKTNKALKQVLILDTCAAGALSNSLVAKRDLPSDQIRAIERLKDNTGFYVLMGASADAVSYEASQYGQGLLTYSLLQAMKGAKLRENQFADVNLLFTFAQETVPTMAKNIGGVQRPLIITPDTSASFDIGKFTTDEQKLINLSNPKPIILRPNFQNKDQDYDDLELTKLLQASLREANYVSSRGGENSLVYVEADEMADAVKPSGSYTIKGDEITVTVRLIRNKIPFNTLTITGKISEKEKLIKEIVEKLVEAANVAK